MPSSLAERDEYAEYFSPSGTITCRVLYRAEQLAFVQFRTEDWPGYREFGYYARFALFREHLRPADPQSPGVMNFVQALVKEAAAHQQHKSKCRHQTNGQKVNAAEVRELQANGENGQKAPVPKACAKATQDNGAKLPPKTAPVRQRKIKVNGANVHSLKPIRSIAGLTLADFLYDR